MARFPAILNDVETVIRDGEGSGRHTNGARVAALESRIREWLGGDDVVGVSSGSAGMRCAFELMELPPGSEVIVPAYTSILSAYPVNGGFAVYSLSGEAAKGGVVPVFVDVDPDTYPIDPERVRAAITERTRAVLAVHMSGQMANMAPLLELAEVHDLAVVEDAEQAHGAAYRDPAWGSTWMAGSAGHFGCSSLSDVKNVGTLGADAGALAISERGADRFAGAAARAWHDTGRAGGHRHHHQGWGIRARMDEYSASECAAELNLLDRRNARRRAIATRYAAALAGGSVAAPCVAPRRSHAFFNVLAKARDLEARDAPRARMDAAAIAPADTYTVVPDQGMYRSGRLLNRCVGSLEVARAGAAAGAGAVLPGAPGRRGRARRGGARGHPGAAALRAGPGDRAAARRGRVTMRSAIPPAARTLGAARLRGTDVPALLLDYNGTLADDEALQARIWVETFAARGIRYGEDAYFARHVGLADPDVVAAVAPHLGPDARAEAITERRRRNVEAAWEARPVTEGAVALLARLDHEGVPWCIVSAATRVEIEAGLRAAGLEHRGVGIVAVDDVCRPKPDPLAYRLALTRLGRSAAEAWAVEDSRTGITAARAAGLRVVGVGTSLPSAVLADLADVVSSVDATLLDMVKEADAADHAARLARKVRP